MPGLYVGPDNEPGPMMYTLDVDGEIFEVRRSRNGGGSDYHWLTGPNEGYGFGSSSAPDVSEEDHQAAIRGFLSMIDPHTGYIGDTDT